MAEQWKRFGAEPLSGTYWVSGADPVVELDANGRDFRYTGESRPFVALVKIDYAPGPQGHLEVRQVNLPETASADSITHYREFVMPEPVEQYHGVPHPPAGPGDVLLRVAPKESRRQIALYLNRLYGVPGQYAGADPVALRKEAGSWLWTYARGACDFGAITQAEYGALVQTIMEQLEPFQPAYGEDE